MTQSTSIVHAQRALAASPRGAGAMTLGARSLSAAVLSCCLALLAAGAWLDPDPSGMGTHRQLGLPRCGFLASTGLPCATCGMTTAVSHAAHGHLIQSFIANPAGAVLAVGTASLAVLSAAALWAGFSIAAALRPLWNRYTLFGIAALVVLSWGYKSLTVSGVF